MKWISEYQLFLFDFDGLLVDTEQFHYKAYIEMCLRRGFQLPWNFSRYSQAAHHRSTDLRDQIYAEFPMLQAMEPNWQVLYEEKKQIFLDLIESGSVPLMPGVAELLLALQNSSKKRCVVTHSAKSLIESIRRKNPLLDTIPHWITREDYTHAKPDPECYQIAISRFAAPHDSIIGFEDSPRGLQALLGTRAKPMLICPPDSVYLEKVLQQHPQVNYYPDFHSL